jgi:group I intron endonuclease
MIFIIMEENVYIYGLVEKRTRYLRYVGKTNDINRRFRRHISERFLRDTYKDRWIRKLMERGDELEVVLIDSVKKTEWQYWEKFYIEYYKFIGCSLTNGTEGGDQPPSTKGRKHTEESKLKMSNTKKGKPIPWLNDGKVRSEEHRKNLSKSLKGRISPNKNKKFDDELKKKLSDASTCKKKVKQMDLEGNIIKIWDSVSLAEKTLQIRHISEVCRKLNHHKTSGGYKWEYL